MTESLPAKKDVDSYFHRLFAGGKHNWIQQTKKEIRKKRSKRGKKKA